MAESLSAPLAAYGADNGAFAEIRAATFSEGPERGLRYLDVRTGGGLRFDVLVDRALDIGAAEFRGSSFAWRSPTGSAHVGHGGFEFLRGFSGLLITGGLDHVFAPRMVDAAMYNYPMRDTISQPMHGRISSLPADHVNWGLTDDDAPTLWIEGRTRQVGIFGEHLVLTRRIEAPVGGAVIRIRDVVENRGSIPQPQRLLYHINFGWPLLDENATIEINAEKTEQLTSVKDARPGVVPPPTAGAFEIAFLHTLRPADPARAIVTNRRTGRRVDVTSAPGAFPYFIEWVHPRATEYAAALEPTTHDPRVLNSINTHLGPGERRSFGVDILVTDQ